MFLADPTETATDYYIGQRGTNFDDCDNGSILTYSECENAAGKLNIEWYGTQSDSASIPKGCVWSANIISYNIHSSGGTSSSVAPVCAGNSN